jgi:hypothetical protein
MKTFYLFIPWKEKKSLFFWEKKKLFFGDLDFLSWVNSLFLFKDLRRCRTFFYRKKEE